MITVIEVLIFVTYWPRLVVHAMLQQLVKQKPGGVPTIIGTTSVLDVGLGLRVNGGLTLLVMSADGVVTILF